MAALLAWLGPQRDTPLDVARFDAALGRLAVRGPAGCRVHRQPGFALAVLLAGTAAEAAAGPQPRRLPLGSRKLLAALDGWFIEPVELARQLDLQAPVGDALTLWLQAYARQGEDGLAQLRGHYVGLLYDGHNHRLLAQRDPGGGRALYFRCDAGGCWLASDESALLTTDPEQALDPELLPRYFAAQVPPAGQGWFCQVQALQAGQQWCFDGRAGRLRRTVRLPSITPPRSDAQAIEQWRFLLRQAVRRCTDGLQQVPALSLSSGLDSQCVAAQLHGLGQDFTAHSWHLPAHPRSDEHSGIQQLVQALGVAWHHFDGSALTPLGGTGTRLTVPGELLANIYRELKHRLYQQVRDHGSRVLLNGDSGDHLYGDPGDWFVHSWRQHRHLQLLREAGSRWRRLGRGIVRDQALRRLASHLLRRPQRWFAPAEFTAAAREQLLHSLGQDPEQTLDSRERLLVGTYTTRAVAAECASSEPLGLEIRSPMRDPDLLAFALQMRPAWSQRGGVRKWITRQALRGQLPEACRLRQKSGDLSFFLRSSLQGPLQQRWRELLQGPGARWSQHVQSDAMFACLQQPQQAREPVLLRLWLCVAFEFWRNACADRAQFPTMESDSFVVQP